MPVVYCSVDSCDSKRGSGLSFFRCPKDEARLCIDEMSIKSHLYYDISKDKIFGFKEGFNSNSAEIAGSALVLMARGIATSIFFL